MSPESITGTQVGGTGMERSLRLGCSGGGHSKGGKEKERGGGYHDDRKEKVVKLR